MASFLAITRICLGCCRTFYPMRRKRRDNSMDTCLKKLDRALSEAIAGMLSEEMQWSPPGKWCVAEVLEHLYLSYTGTVKGFERVAAAGKPLTTAATWAQRRRALIVVGFGYMPKGRKAPAVVQPRGLPSEKVRTEIMGALRK